jgi:hypothetical protein
MFVQLGYVLPKIRGQEIDHIPLAFYPGVKALQPGTNPSVLIYSEGERIELIAEAKGRRTTDRLSRQPIMLSQQMSPDHRKGIASVRQIAVLLQHARNHTEDAAIVCECNGRSLI